MAKKRGSADLTKAGKEGHEESKDDTILAPRRSTRVSSAPPSQVSKSVPPKARKERALASTSASSKKSKETFSKVPTDKDNNSLSVLSDPPSENGDEKESEGDKLPPKKKPKVDKTPSSSSKQKHSLKVGDVLTQDLKLLNHDEEEIRVLDLIKEKGSVIFLYPKANTPACTSQACGFRDVYDEISRAGFQVFGLSMDSPKAQKNWKEKQKLSYSLLCDPKQHLIGLLGGSLSSTKVQRSHYIIEAGGKILDITSPASAKTSPREALEFIKKI